jgi:hypothetical protein
LIKYKEKKMAKKNWFLGTFVLALMIVLVFASCGGKEPAKLLEQLTKLQEQVNEATSVGNEKKAARLNANMLKLQAELEKAHAKADKVVFGDFPADNEITYLGIVGYSELTLKTLFGSNAVFASTFQGNPSTVTLESAKGNAGEFTAVLLLTVPLEEKAPVQMRMQVRFVSDGVGGNKLNYIKVDIPGQTIEETADGSQRQDGKLIGVFVEMLGIFWDKTNF